MSADNTLAAFCAASSTSGGVAIGGDATAAESSGAHATLEDATNCAIGGDATGEEAGATGDSSSEH